MGNLRNYSVGAQHIFNVATCEAGMENYEPKPPIKDCFGFALTKEKKATKVPAQKAGR